MADQTCSACHWWGARVNCIISATIKDSVQACCNPVVEPPNIIVTHATDSCAQWKARTENEDG